MTQQVINIGAAPDDHTGDPARTAFDKCNGNFGELYASSATILDGGVPPADALGVDGDYYVDTVGRDLYGPKDSSGISYKPEAFMLPDTAPAASQGLVARFANTFKVLKDGHITGCRFYRNATSASTTRSLTLFNAAQTLIATSNPTTETGGVGGWITATFPTPINVSANDVLTICYDESGNSHYTSGAPPTAVPADVTFMLGRWGTINSGFPLTGTGAFNFFADLKWEAAEAGAIWPLAVPSYPWVQMTQAAYDALTPKDANTLYVIVG